MLYSTRKRRAPAHILLAYVATDVLAFVVSFFFAFGIACAIDLYLFQRMFLVDLESEGVTHFARTAIIAVGVLAWFAHKRHYRVRMPFWQETKDIVSASAFALIVNGFLQFAIKDDLSRLWLMLDWVFFGFFVVGFRFLLRFVLMRFGLWKVPTLLVGCGITAHNVLSALRSEPGIGYDIITQINDMPHSMDSSGQTWAELYRKHGVNFAIVALDAPALEQSEQIVARLAKEQLAFSIVPPLPSHMPVSCLEPHYLFSDDVMLFVPLRGLQQPLPRFIKRAMDMGVSALALLTLSPVMLALAVLIKRDGGPALFGHTRLGLNGKTFKCLKFRSMVTNSEQALKDYLAKHPEAAKEWETEWKLREDPRITSIGHFIRKWSLDELPQLLNVLKGEMSLVGPRPVVVQETEKYSDDLQYYYSVRPGLTGLWQVSGRNDVSYAKRVHMDSWYVRNWSLWHDIIILIKTVKVLVNRTGAY